MLGEHLLKVAQIAFFVP